MIYLKKRTVIISLMSGFVVLGLLYLLRNTLVGDLYGHTAGQIGKGPSRETFTLTGELPHYFSLDIISYYQKDRSDECLRYSAKAGRRMSYFTGMKQQVAMSSTG